MSLADLRHTLGHPAFLRAQRDLHSLTRIGSMVVPPNCMLLEATTRDLRGARRCYLLILEAAGDSAVEGVAEVLTWLGQSGGEVFIATDRDVIGGQLAEFVPASAQYLQGASEVFRRFVGVESDFAKLPLLKARSDFPIDDFQRAYHSRLAKILNWPGRERAGDVVEMDDFWNEWNQNRNARLPVLLLGDRGSGKTWELLHYTARTIDAALESPWSRPIPFYVPLSDFREYFTATGRTIPSLPRLIRKRYDEIPVAYGDATFEGLFDCGHFVACLDGLDEILLNPSEKQVIETFQRLISESALDSSLIFSARESHFKSLSHILDLDVWDGGRLFDHFVVLRLNQFDPATSNDVARIVATKSGYASDEPSFDIVDEILAQAQDVGVERGIVESILRVVSSHPALVTELATRLINRNKGSTPWAVELLEIIDSTMLEYNISHERTSDMIVADEGRYIRLGAAVRTIVLEEFAHILAVRHRDAMPAHLASMKLGVLVDAASSEIEREFRVQTVLELPRDGSPGVRFALRFPEFDDEEGPSSMPGTETSLWAEAAASAPVAVTSVCGAAYLARWVFRRLDATSSNPSGGAEPLQHREELLSVLGLFPLGPPAGAILKSLLEGRRSGSLRDLKHRALSLLRDLAAAGDLRVYSPRLRHLCHNLQALGVLTPEERSAWDPWTDPVCAIVEGVAPLSGLSLILVPPVRDASLMALVPRSEGDQPAHNPRPFLLGSSEITNAQFMEFISSEEGKAWDVARVTRAGGGEVSDGKAIFTNEYHLYHWHRGEGHEYGPPDEVRDHPVSYVSWYAATDYCGWLTRLAKDQHPTDISALETEVAAFRLPTAAEWLWVAQGGYTGITYPWNLHGGLEGVLWPFPDDEGGPADGLKNLAFQRDRLRKLLLDDTKQTRPVGTELLSSFGAFGLVGNVKEWGHDLVVNGAGNSDKRVILGGSANLGEASFRFDYFTYLFPENTNPDVGFRVCRSLTDAEVSLLAGKEREIASRAVIGEVDPPQSGG